MSAGVALPVGWADLSIWMATWTLEQTGTGGIDRVGLKPEEIPARLGRGWPREKGHSVSQDGD
jgi:hypothetical protein